MAFNIPINSIEPLSTPSDWVRPSDWLAITDTANEVQFLVADTGVKAFTIRTTFTRTSGNIYIDWGDGVVDTISTTTSTDTSHVYSTGGTPCSRGYNTFKIRIYGDATCVITNAQHISNFSVAGANPYYNIGLLEAYFGDNTCNTTAFNSNYFNSNNATLGLSNFQMLEYVKLPATVSWTTQMVDMFKNCNNLYKVIMPTSASSLTSLLSTFNNCKNLLDITLPSNATAITILNSTFSYCEKLRTISFPTSLDNCTDFGNFLYNCISIKNVTFPSINSATSLSNCMNNCTSLQWFRFTSLPTFASPQVVGFDSFFYNCPNLQNVYFPNTCSANARISISSLFFKCINLKNVIFPVNFNIDNFNNTFEDCYSLKSVICQSSSPNLVSISSTFKNCYSLTSFTLPSSVGNGVYFDNTFENCISLTSITIPSSYKFASLGYTFNGCFNLLSVNLPNTNMDNLLNMSFTFQNCKKLTSISWFTSMNGIFAMDQAFVNCESLNSITLPASMNTIINFNSTFLNCYNLKSVTMPTSVSNCTSFNSTFQNCYNIQSITLPSTVSSSLTSFSSTFANCYSLKSVTLPTTQTASCNNISNIFQGCSSLTTINNLSKIGSLTATPLVNATIGNPSFCNSLTSLSFSCPFSVLRFNGNSVTQNFNKLNSIRLLNASAGQYTGASPQINVSFSDLGITALNQLFTDLPTVTSKTINITSCTGAAGCTRSIATAKGWTVTG